MPINVIIVAFGTARAGIGMELCITEVQVPLVQQNGSAVQHFLGVHAVPVLLLQQNTEMYPDHTRYQKKGQLINKLARENHGGTKLPDCQAFLS